MSRCCPKNSPHWKSAKADARVTRLAGPNNASEACAFEPKTMRKTFFLRLAALTILAYSLTGARAQYSVLRINEVLADNTLITNSYGSVTDMIEIYNGNEFDWDLFECSLSDSNTFPRRYVFPPGSVVPAFGVLAIPCDSLFTNIASFAVPPVVPFGVKASGGFLYLYDPAEQLIDSVEYGLQLRNHSIVRVDATTWTLGTPSPGSGNTTLPLGTPFALKINEWLADQSSGGTKDYFEIYNRTNVPVPLGGLYLTDSSLLPLQYEVAPLSFIGTGTLAYVRFNADAKGGTTGTTNRYPADEVNFKLSGSGDSIIIYNNFFQEIDRVVFGNQQKDVSEGYLPDANTNNLVRFPKINDYNTTSPGEANFLILTNIAINEILTHTDPPLEDVVEFINRAPTNVNISGWWLSNSRSNPRKYLIPSGPALTPNGFRMIYEGTGIATGFNSSSATIPFTFNSARGDQVVLSQTDGLGNLTGYIAYESFESAANGISFGYYKTSVPDDYKFVAMAETTFGVDEPTTVTEFRAGTGLSNAYPKIGPLVINEIMYAPSNTIYFTNGIPVFGQNVEDEFIELRNVTSLPVPLYDPAYPTNQWKLRKAVDFSFPLIVLAANSFCLVVGFDPVLNPTALAAFTNRYNVSPSIPIFGPWNGRLSDGGDSVELYRPDSPQLPGRPDAGYVPFIRVDKVNYNTSPPWPSGANGTGKALQRKNSLLFGNDLINWADGAPTAGEPTSSELVDSDGDGIPDAWELQYGFDPNNIADAGLDPDGDTTSNLGEYVAGTNPTNATSVLKVHSVIPSPDNVQPAYVRFYAYSNATYTVEYRKNMNDSSNWKKVGDVPAETFERWVLVPDQGATNSAASLTNTVSDRYYRVIAPATN